MRTPLFGMECPVCARRSLWWNPTTGIVCHAMDKQNRHPTVFCTTRLPDSDPTPVVYDSCQEHLKCIMARSR